MNAIIVNAVYPPEPVISAQMGWDLAMHLVCKGDTVTVLCPFPTRPIGAKHEGYENTTRIRVEQQEGVQVVRVPSFTAPESRLTRRMLESFSFGWHACRYLETHCKDGAVVYANAWPLLGQALIARHCALRGIPLVFHIMDIYPEALLLKLPECVRAMVAAPLTAMDRWIVRKAVKVVVISENMRRTYVEGRGLAPDKVVAIPNWADERRFARLPSRTDACAHYGIPEDPFTFLYLGNIGPVAGVEGLIEAFHASQLQQAQLVIAGDGSSKAGCVELATRMGVNHVRFISDPDVENVPLIQSLGHVYLLPVRKGAGMSSIPSKLMAYLFSQRPIVATVDKASDTARCLCDANCGWVGDPENIPWLAAKMTEVAAMSESVLSAFGQRGRRYGLKHFSKAEGVRTLGMVVADAALTQ